MTEQLRVITDEELLLMRDRQMPEMFPGGVPPLHNIWITPQRYELHPLQGQMLEYIARGIPAYITGLARISELATINDSERRSDWNWKMVRKALELESGFQEKIRTTQKFEGQNVAAEEEILSRSEGINNPLNRLDLVEEDGSGRLMIAEVEVGKSHGMGYGSWASHMMENPTGIGIVNVLADMSRDEPVAIILSELERFYEMESDYLVRKVAEAGGRLIVIPERELSVRETGVTNARLGGLPVHRLLSKPILTGVNRTDKYKSDMRRINELLATGEMEVVSDRRPELSNKAGMALISNAGGDEWLENLVWRCFTIDELGLIRPNLPETMYLPMMSDQKRQVIMKRIAAGQRFFVKNRSMSGGRGIIPPDRPEEQLALLVTNGRADVIVQEAINPRWNTVKAIDMEEGRIDIKDCTSRISLFAWDGQIADLAVTATPSLIAHGGTDSIIMGVKC